MSFDKKAERGHDRSLHQQNVLTAPAAHYLQFTLAPLIACRFPDEPARPTPPAERRLVVALETVGVPTSGDVPNTRTDRTSKYALS